jgi:hypothetical protein
MKEQAWNTYQKMTEENRSTRAKTCSNATVHRNTWTGLGLKMVSNDSRTFTQYSECYTAF